MARLVLCRKLDTLLTELRGLGGGLHERQGIEDVTRKYTGVDARLRNMAQTEQRLVALLTQPGRPQRRARRGAGWHGCVKRARC